MLTWKNSARVVQYLEEVPKMQDGPSSLIKQTLLRFQKCPRRGICGYFFLSFFNSQDIMKKSSNDTFFVHKEVLGEKIIIYHGNIFIQIKMFSL